MASSSRAPTAVERRVVLEALLKSLGDLSLPRVLPKFPTKAGRELLPKYTAASSTARRDSSPPSCFQVVMRKVQQALNAERRRAALSGATPILFSETDISYSVIINYINPLGNVIGFEDNSVSILTKLSTGRNHADALTRLYNLEHPFAEPPPPPPPPQPQPQPPQSASGAAPSNSAVRASHVT